MNWPETIVFRNIRIAASTSPADWHGALDCDDLELDIQDKRTQSLAPKLLTRCDLVRYDARVQVDFIG